MAIYRCFMLEQKLLIRAVSNRHDIDVLEVGARFPPVTMRQNVVPSYFAARFDLAPARNSPVKQGIKPRDANAAGRWFYMLEESGKTANDLPRIQRFRDAGKLVEGQARFLRARRPWPRLNLFRSELTFEREQDVPFSFVKIDDLNRNH